MSKISIKTDFADGEKLFAQELNNNFLVIQAGINANEENLQEVIDQAIIELDKQLEEITADRGWDWNGGDRVTFYKGNAQAIEDREIINGQLLYNTETGETALDDAGKRVVTGSGNVVEINNGSTPSNPATKLWIDRNKIVKTRASQVTNSMDGNETDIAPSVNAVKNYVNSKKITYLNYNTLQSTGFTPTEDCYIEIYASSSGWGYAGAKVQLTINNSVGNAEKIVDIPSGTQGHDTVPDSMFTVSVYKLKKDTLYKFSLGGITGGYVYSGLFGKLIPFI